MVQTLGAQTTHRPVPEGVAALLARVDGEVRVLAELLHRDPRDRATTTHNQSPGGT